MWSACGTTCIYRGLPKNAGDLAWVCVCVFVARTTASYSASICASAVQNTGTIGIELSFIATYVQRVPAVPSDYTGTIKSNDTIPPAP